MSVDIFGRDIAFAQRFFSAEGLYAGNIDGLWGPLTEQAAVRFYELTDIVRSQFVALDSRTERNIQTLRINVQAVARRQLEELQSLDGGLTVRIISGTRSYEQQRDLYRQGRWGNPGPVVTRARPGYSFHNFGLAWDIGVFDSEGSYLTNAETYELVAARRDASEVAWGGDWTGFYDPSHFQLQSEDDLETVRVAFEQ